MTDNTDALGYDRLKAQAIFACDASGEIMESLAGCRDLEQVAQAIEVAKLIVMGGQVFATLALAEAEKDSIRYFEERATKRPFATRSAPVTPINKFQKD